MALHLMFKYVWYLDPPLERNSKVHFCLWNVYTITFTANNDIVPKDSPLIKISLTLMQMPLYKVIFITVLSRVALN